MKKPIREQQGHWILAKMGKKVLRPGGKELTTNLVREMNIKDDDHVVEFAPGLGYTASLVLKKEPENYTAVELDEFAAKRLKKIISGNNRKIINGSASNTNLPSENYHKVYGEAMLSMHADHRKAEIIKEAYRLLKHGGYYGIHELGLTPNDLSSELKAKIQKDLAKVIKVNARPLTLDEWKDLLIKQGFKIKYYNTNPMFLLETKRIIDDEGLARTLKIGFNILTHPSALKRILAMKKTFRRYQNHLNAVIIVAEKA